jgi:O-methyltransferase involved in polyketide biosynthesis
MSEKKRIISTFSSIPVNLIFQQGDALYTNDVKKSASIFDRNKPLTIINEGLMRYFSFDQKKILANNIRSLLDQFGGVWITSDISLKKILEQEDKITANITNNLSKLTERNIETEFI